MPTAEKNALTLAVVCVEQRVEQLRAQWRALSPAQQAEMPGLEDQLGHERAALRHLEQMRDRAYRTA